MFADAELIGDDAPAEHNRLKIAKKIAERRAGPRLLKSAQML
ncbi:hypothetical protein [Caballeronia sp. J97]|nr:hypothetical protein [Caballeronia sp. J97]